MKTTQTIYQSRSGQGWRVQITRGETFPLVNVELTSGVYLFKNFMSKEDLRQLNQVIIECLQDWRD